MIINKDLIIEGTNKSLNTLNTEVNKFKKVSLFSGNTASNFTLYDSANNYTRLLIEYHDTGGQYYSTNLLFPYNKRIDLFCLDADSGTMYFKTVSLHINGTSATFVDSQKEMYWVGNDRMMHEGGPWIYIDNVWGYKDDMWG